MDKMLTSYLNHSFHCGFGTMSGAKWSEISPVSVHIHSASHLCVANLWFSRRRWALCESLALSKTEGHIASLKSITLDFFPTAHPSEETGRHSWAPYDEVRTRPALTKNRIPIYSKLWPEPMEAETRWEVCGVLANMVNIFIHCNMHTSVFELFGQFLHEAYFQLTISVYLFEQLG